MLLLARIRPALDAELPAELLHSGDGDAELLRRLALWKTKQACDGVLIDLKRCAPPHVHASFIAGLASRKEVNSLGARLGSCDRQVAAWHRRNVHQARGRDSRER